MGFMNLFGGGSSRAPGKLERTPSTGTFESPRNEYQFLTCQHTGGICWHCQSITRDLVISACTSSGQDRFYLCASHINDPEVCVSKSGSPPPEDESEANSSSTNSSNGESNGNCGGSSSSSSSSPEKSSGPIMISLSENAFMRRSSVKNGCPIQAVTRVDLPGRKLSRQGSTQKLAFPHSVGVAAESSAVY